MVHLDSRPTTFMSKSSRTAPKVHMHRLPAWTLPRQNARTLLPALARFESTAFLCAQRTGCLPSFDHCPQVYDCPELFQAADQALCSDPLLKLAVLMAPLRWLLLFDGAFHGAGAASPPGSSREAALNGWHLSLGTGM